MLALIVETESSVLKPKKYLAYKTRYVFSEDSLNTLLSSLSARAAAQVSKV